MNVMKSKYPALACPSVILAIALVGASAAAHAGDIPTKSPASAVNGALPAATPSSGTAAPPAPSSSVGGLEFISPEVIERARQRIRARALLARVRSGSAEDRAPAGPAVETRQQAPALPAKLPLPNTLVARTIERIGYACGAVASATALEGDEPGMYKVTCTSGQSYQARPVHGRYHFRRW